GQCGTAGDQESPSIHGPSPSDSRYCFHGTRRGPGAVEDWAVAGEGQEEEVGPAEFGDGRWRDAVEVCHRVAGGFVGGVDAALPAGDLLSALGHPPVPECVV